MAEIEDSKAGSDEVVSVIAEAIASRTFGYHMAGGSKTRRAMRPVALTVLEKLYEAGYVICPRT